MPKTPPQDVCPCQSGRTYNDCCGPCHKGSHPAQNAEALMRSRYTAFVLDLPDYLLASWHPDTRPASLNLQEAPVPNWLGLQIKAHRPISDTQAEVEFVARYKVAGRAFRLHETSRFIGVDGRWYYVDGDQHGS